MGYRSTFVTDDTSVVLPQWFVDKYETSVFIKSDHTMPIASSQEMKCYGHWADLPTDLQRVLRDGYAPDDWRTITLMFLHEDGKFTRHTISADSIETYDDPA